MKSRRNLPPIKSYCSEDERKFIKNDERVKGYSGAQLRELTLAAVKDMAGISKTILKKV